MVQQGGLSLEFLALSSSEELSALVSKASQILCGELRHPTRLSGRASSSLCGAPLLQAGTGGCCAARRRQRGTWQVVRAEADFYETLGVPRNADKKAIKSAYRQKARKFHPDVNKESGAEETFKRISNAYEVLSDDQKRSIYDRYGEAGLKGSMGGGGAADMGGFNNPFDLFEQFFGASVGGRGGFGGGFGGTGGRSRAVQGEDEKYELVLDFNDAVFGSSKDIEVSRLEACTTCSGSGVKAGSTPATCGTCGGSGQVVQAVRTPLGNFQQVSGCPECEGAGETSTPCSTCGGDGRVRKSKRISLRVPPGVDDGSRLRVRGEGNAGRRGGEPGDLYVFIGVRPHPKGLRREGTTVHSDIDISYVDAILGTTVQVTTVDGLVDLKIPSGTQPGTTLVMAKRGVPRLGSSSVRGDHQVHVRVTIPSRLGKDEHRLVEELRELQGSKVKAGSRWGL
ncbi:hypothetical protein WJX81_006848 [Elliptochloris bilobata]|uniref:Uncharacterized protein n=1 Tax=Elliptochloris bilobata TaxID=381761 RepID=A0AAW1QJZ1_9CHLO